MEGAISALREEGKGQDIVAIVNEITRESRAVRADDVVTMAVATPLRRLCQELMALMAWAIETRTAGGRGRHFCRSISIYRKMKLMEVYHKRRVSFRK